MHRCTACGKLKAPSEFNKNRSRKSGLQAHCRDCNRAARNADPERDRARSRAYYAQNRERIRAEQAEYRAENHERIIAQQRESWAKNRDQRTAEKRSRYAQNRDRILAAQALYRAANSDKKAATDRAWVLANPEKAREHKRGYRERNLDKVRASARAYVKRHPEQMRAAKSKYRALKLSATVEPVTATAIAERMQMFGSKCWMCGGPFQHVDHVKPLSQGGPHILANLRPACRTCNLSKGGRWLGAKAAHAIAYRARRLDFVALSGVTP